jgi:hypothetical protein
VLREMPRWAGRDTPFVAARESMDTNAAGAILRCMDYGVDSSLVVLQELDHRICEPDHVSKFKYERHTAF